MKITKLPVIVALLLSVVITVSCQSGSGNDDRSVIYTSDSYVVYADSVVIGDSLVAVSPPPTPDDSATPSCTGGAPIVTNLFNRSSRAIPALLDPDSLNLTETAIAIITSAALTHPDESADALRRLVNRSGTVVKLSDWPVTSARQLWAVAAWQVWLATGSHEWLKESRKVISATLAEELAATFDDSLKMVRGGYPDIIYPLWMNGCDIYSTMSLTNNTATARALEILDMIDKELGLPCDDTRSRTAAEIKAAVNESMWIPNFGYYGEFLYGQPYPIASHAADNLGQAAAIVCGTATGDMAESIISRTPLIDGATPKTYPSPHGHAPEFSAGVQALWNMAASTTGNCEARTAGLGALIRLTAFSTNPSLAIAAADMSAATTSIAGIRLEPDRMTFNPMMPAAAGDRFTISGLPYRGAILDITIEGSGSSIAVFKLDDRIHTDPAVSSTISPGRHSVVIVMDNHPHYNKKNGVTTGEAVQMPPTPSAIWPTPRHGQIIGHDGDTEFMVYINGIFDQQINGSEFDLFDAYRFTTVTIAPVRDENIWGYAPRPHWFVAPGSVRELPATALGAPVPRPRRIGRKLRRQPPPRFVESDIRQNRTISTAVTYSEGGRALVDIVYANPGPHTMVRTLRVGDRRFAPLVLPPTGSQSRTIRSNPVWIQLADSLNHIAIEPPAHAAGNTTLYVESMRIIRM